MRMSTQTEFATVNEVAKALHVSTATVYRWCQTGKLTALQVGGRGGLYRVPLPVKMPEGWRER
jgi:excisionase family DNA binding protein